MSYTKHHAIIVTSWDPKAIEAASEKAKEIFGSLVSNAVKSNTNGFISFFVAPDGSNEGWAESEKGNENRKLFIDWIKTRQHEDGSNDLSYVELFYDDDEKGSEIVGLSA